MQCLPHVLLNNNQGAMCTVATAAVYTCAEALPAYTAEAAQHLLKALPFMQPP
jgi:hypothetical protein